MDHRWPSQLLSPYSVEYTLAYQAMERPFSRQILAALTPVALSIELPFVASNFPEAVMPSRCDSKKVSPVETSRCSPAKLPKTMPQRRWGPNARHRSSESSGLASGTKGFRDPCRLPANPCRHARSRQPESTSRLAHLGVSTRQDGTGRHVCTRREGGLARLCSR